MNEELKRVIERYRERNSNQSEYQDSIVYSEDVDAGILAEAYLAEHPADDDEPLSQEWLSSVSRGVFGKVAFVSYELLDDASVWRMLGDDRGWYLFTSVKTRGDVRRLCRALGIELKGKP